MRWKFKDFSLIVIDRGKWHKWFAWYPVRISATEIAWLEYVERKGTYFLMRWHWKYRTIQEK